MTKVWYWYKTRRGRHCGRTRTLACHICKTWSCHAIQSYRIIL